MKKSLPLILVVVLSIQAFAQNKYTEEVFAVGKDEAVVYGHNYEWSNGMFTLKDLEMDVYYPKNDLEGDRPLIIFLHAGSFLPRGYNFLPYGDRTDSCLVELCKQFAKRGWVAASIDYRTGWSPLGGDQESKGSTLIQAVYRSVHDARNAVRYFRYTDTWDKYKINIDKIVMAGDNSGAISAVAVATLDKVSELTLPKFLFSSTGLPYVDPTVMGQPDGSGGDATQNNYELGNYSSDVNMVLNLGGSIGDSTWLEAGDVPIVSFHGLADAVYGTAVVTVGATGDPVVEVSGSHDLMARSTRLGNQDVILNSAINFADEYTGTAEKFTSTQLAKAGLYPWAGGVLEASFDPFAWYDPFDPNIDNSTPGATGFGSSSNPFANPIKGRSYIDTIMSYFTPRAMEVLNLSSTPAITFIEEAYIVQTLDVYPIPAKNVLYVEVGLNAKMIDVSLFSSNGNRVRTYNPIAKNSMALDISGLAGGMYLLEIHSNHGRTTKRVLLD